MTAETRWFKLGPYIVYQRPLKDNPAFALFIMSRDGVVLGKQCSVPQLSDCKWHELQRGVYASDTKSRDKSAGRRGR